MASNGLDHLALFLPSLNGGGAQRVMVTLAGGLARRGLKVDLVLAHAEGPYLDEVPADVRIVDLKARQVMSSLPALVRYLRRERPAVMMATINHANIVAVGAKRLAALPVRVVVRESNTLSSNARHARNYRGQLIPYLMQHVYPWADGIVAPSRGVAADLVNQLHLPSERIRVIYNPTVTPELRELARAPLDHPWFASGQPPVILGVGSLKKQKGFATLIRAFNMMRRQRPARLMILGEGPDRAELEALVQVLGLHQEVALPGFAKNPFAYMARADAFVLSSAWEGLPNVLIQALACGCPVVSTDCPSGPAEILEHGKYGRLVPVGDVNKLAEAVLDSLSQPTPAAQLREASRRFEADGIIDSYLELLRGSGHA